MLDEPTSGLDPLMEQAFQQCVRERRADGVTVLLSSHILGEVEALADRVSIIRRGRTVTTGTPRRAAPAYPDVACTPSPSREPAGMAGADGVADYVCERLDGRSTAGSPSTPSTSTRSSAGCTRHASTP